MVMIFFPENLQTVFLLKIKRYARFQAVEVINEIEELLRYGFYPCYGVAEEKVMSWMDRLGQDLELQAAHHEKDRERINILVGRIKNLFYNIRMMMNYVKQIGQHWMNLRAFKCLALRLVILPWVYGTLEKDIDTRLRKASKDLEFILKEIQKEPASNMKEVTEKMALIEDILIDVNSQPKSEGLTKGSGLTPGVCHPSYQEDDPYDHVEFKKESNIVGQLNHRETHGSHTSRFEVNKFYDRAAIMATWTALLHCLIMGYASEGPEEEEEEEDIWTPSR